MQRLEKGFWVQGLGFGVFGFRRFGVSGASGALARKTYELGGCGGGSWIQVHSSYRPQSTFLPARNPKLGTRNFQKIPMWQQGIQDQVFRALGTNPKWW